MKIEIALVIFYAFVMCNKCAFGIYLSELFGNGEDKDPVKDKVMKYYSNYILYMNNELNRGKKSILAGQCTFCLKG